MYMITKQKPYYIKEWKTIYTHTWKKQRWRVKNRRMNLQSKGCWNSKEPWWKDRFFESNFTLEIFVPFEKKISDNGWLNLLGWRISYAILAQGTERFVDVLTVYYTITNQTVRSNTKMTFFHYVLCKNSIYMWGCHAGYSMVKM
jgi:hypothetical protein